MKKQAIFDRQLSRAHGQYAGSRPSRELRRPAGVSFRSPTAPTTKISAVPIDPFTDHNLTIYGVGKSE